MNAHDKPERAARLEEAIRLKKAAAPHPPDLPPRPAEQPAYLGDMQRSLWLAHQIDPNSAAYNLTSAFRVRGPLDPARLQQAFNQVVSEHCLLRSTFAVDRDAVLQVVHPHAPLTVDVLEVDEGRGLPVALAEARRPFDLETGPLARLRLIEETVTHERVLLLVLHHILADERSLGVLWKALAEAYEGRRAEAGPRRQYDDYLHWLRQGDLGRNQDLEYWRRRLTPLPDDLRLPFERPASETGLAPGRLLNRTLNRTVTSGIGRLAAATGATRFMVFAFAFRLLLHRYTQGQQVAFATPVSTRSHPATANMIGYFLNPVLVSTLVDEERRVERAVHDFGREMKEALAHASLPFQVLAEELSPPRQRDRHPIFQAMFVYQESGPPPTLGDARLEPVTLDLGASKFDMTLFVNEGARSLDIAVEYRTDRFDEVWMHNLLGHYEALLEHLPEDLGRLTAEVPMLGALERDKLAADAQGADLEAVEKALLLPQQILDAARRAPGSPAVVCGGVRQSYRELERAAHAIAQALSAGGVRPGDRVGVCLDRSALMIAGILGSHWAGAAYVPLDPGYPRERTRDQLEDADVAAVLTTSRLRDQLPAGPWPTIDIDGLDGAGPQTAGSSHLPAELTPDSPAYILYTSGSTGRPKGVVVAHGNLRASTLARLQAYDTAPKRFLLVPSLAFDSSVAGIFWTLAAAGTLVIPTEDEVRDPRRLAQLVAAERVTGLLCIPSLYAQLLEVGSDSLRGLESAIVAGESCPSRLAEDHFRAVPRVRLFNEYGPTEATVWATVHELTGRDATRPVPIGRPIPGVRVDVLDALGRRVPAGIPGHAWIAGRTVAQGYWRRPDATAERFVVDTDRTGTTARRYRTGDRMAWTEDGQLLFLGREDEQIKLRGFRIEPAEIEAAFVEVAGVEQAAVVARPLDSDGTPAARPDTIRLVAFVETTLGGATAGWRQDLARRLSDHMIPTRLVELPALPRLPNGKIDRQQLRNMALAPEVRRTEESRILTTREQALISLWEGLLGRSGIRLTDNFFELGGHSLLVVELALAIERDFEVTLSAADVFQNPTVRELAGRIEQRGGSAMPAYQHLFPIQPRGRKMPFIVAVPHFFAGMFAARFRGERPVYGLRGVSLRPEGNRGRWRTMADLGEELVGEIRRRFGDERCILAGYSFGASMAIEAARIMEARGVPAHRLYLIAPMPEDLYRVGPFCLQIDGLRQPVNELSMSEAARLYARANHLLTRRPYQRAWRWFAIEPWRRVLCGVGGLRKRVGLPLTPRILHADVRVERFRLHARYRPGLVRTPTVIFNARDTESDAAATWRPYFAGPLTVIGTPDPHDEASVEAARQVILHHLRDIGDA